VFFRANKVEDAFTLYERVATTTWSMNDLWILREELNTGLFEATLALLVVFLFIDPFYDGWIKRERHGPTGWKGQIAFASLAVAVLIFGYFGSTSFIYFQF